MEEKIPMEVALPAPECPSEAETVLSEMELSYNACRISVNDTYEEDEFLFNIDGQGFFPRGNISCIKAKEKSGKTLSECILSATALSGELWRIKANESLNKVIMLDTEQSRSDGFNTYKRALTLAGLCQDEFEIFEYISLREMDVEKRMEMVEYSISNRGADFVCIDGIVDLMQDFNNNTESQTIITKLMKLSSRYNCHILCVIHENPSTEKARGHIGTMLPQKASETLRLSKDNGIFKVSCVSSRHKGIPDWSFTFDNEDNLVSADELQMKAKMEKQAKQEADKAEKRQKELQKLCDIITAYLLTLDEKKAKRSEVAKHLQEVHSMSHGKVYECLSEIEVKGMISFDSKYYFIDMLTDDVAVAEETTGAEVDFPISIKTEDEGSEVCSSEERIV